MRHISLLEDPKPLYEAISYYWGDANLHANVIVDGLTVDVPPITEEALRHLRHTDKHRTLLIDALTINQTNISERSQQVAFTGVFQTGRTLLSQRCPWHRQDERGAVAARSAHLVLDRATQAWKIN